MVPKKRKKATKAQLADPDYLPPVILREHQQEALNAFDAGLRNQCNIWHRRGGKDWYGMFLAERQAQVEVGTYWHLLPKHIQAKRAIWNGIDHISGKRFVELLFPTAVAVNNTEMFIELENGSTWQLLGSDNYDRMVGSNPRGVVFSEWALCDPRAYDYIRPILRANKGWANFITTFRGRNHAFQMYNNLKTNREWYTSLRTIDDTGIVSAADVEKDRSEGMSERLVQQEYYCVPAPPVSLGAYARVFDSLEQLGSVRELPDSVRENSTQHLALGVKDDYTALLECSVRGSTCYISGGKIERNFALHEILRDHLAALASGKATLAGAEDFRIEAVNGIGIPMPLVREASRVETSTYLERAIISPTSVLTAALTGGIDVCLDEEGDPLKATEAVFDAVQRLAAISGAANIRWGKGQDYTAQDRAIIGRRAHG